MTEETKPVFDVSRPISIKLQSPGGAKVLSLRYPTDQEWTDRQRNRKIVIRQLGRGVSETITPDSSDADLELVKTLVSGECPEIDGYEATRILDQLGQAEVTDVLSDGGCYTVTLRVAGGVVSHSMAIPSAKDIFKYRRSFATSRDLPYNNQQLTINFTGAGDLYRKLGAKAFGYEGEAPITHQVAAVQAVIDAVESGSGVAGSENF